MYLREEEVPFHVYAWSDYCILISEVRNIFAGSAHKEINFHGKVEAYVLRNVLRVLNVSFSEGWV